MFGLGTLLTATKHSGICDTP